MVKHNITWQLCYQKNMPKGISIHIGVKKLDTRIYTSDGELNSPENDAHAMKNLAQKQGFTTNLLLTEMASKDALLLCLKQAANNLFEGDMLLITYTGHGGQIANVPSIISGISDDEPDGSDETWCLYNGLLIDDEIGEIWKLFNKGVRIVAVSSSCNSQNALRLFNFEENKLFPGNAVVNNTKAPVDRGAVFYYTKDPEIKASILHLSSSLGGQDSFDGDPYSKFIGTLLKHWKNGAFKGNYIDLVSKIRSETGYSQLASLGILGIDDENFKQKKPFTF